MITTLNNTTALYEQTLQSTLASATTSADLINGLTTFDDIQQNERLTYVLNNYQKTHLSSVAEATLIEGAIATL